jgi:hypothetical protein
MIVATTNVEARTTGRACLDMLDISGESAYLVRCALCVFLCYISYWCGRSAVSALAGMKKPDNEALYGKFHTKSW